jgi:hypothetical protein
MFMKLYEIKIKPGQLQTFELRALTFPLTRTSVVLETHKVLFEWRATPIAV